MLEYIYREDAPPPFSHQSSLFNSTREARFYGVFWEQGCAKTRYAIDRACDLYRRGEIDAVVVVAPNGVHRNWVTDEIPEYAPRDVLDVSNMFYWNTKKANNVSYKSALGHLLQHKGLMWLMLTYESVMTDNCKDFLWKVLKKRRVFYILDESSMIKNPGAKRTKRIVASGVYAGYRIIMDGTPVTQGPFDVYAPVKFLQEDFWTSAAVCRIVPYGFGSFAAFKRHFAIWRTAAEVKAEKGYDPGYDQLLGYRNLDQLQQILALISDRKLKDEVLDLPPKLYSKRYFDMSPPQAKAYEELKEEFMTFLDSGELVTADLAIVRLLRLQQITCGYLPSGLEDGRLLPIGNHNPRMEEFKEIAQAMPHPAIVWARFSQDIDQIMDCLRSLGLKAGRYDGKISDDECERTKLGFQDGSLDWFVGNPAKGATGLTLIRAKSMIYYNNNFKLRDRLQSEDRAHRAGMDEHPVNYIDLLASGTVDEKITAALRKKMNIASEITGDALKEWL